MSRRADGTYSQAWRNVTKIVLRPTIRALMKHDWQGQENFPESGGVIIAVNHLSYADTMAMSLFCDQSGHYPTFLAKSSLFEMKVLGPLMARFGQLPVYRDQANAALVLRDAERALSEGACIVFYPEGTVTRDPDLWPMVSKTGVARLALATGAPVIPVAHWGAQDVLPYGSFRPRILPRRTVHVIAGPPVDLSAFAGSQPDNATLRAATDHIMRDVAILLGRLRGEIPPAKPYHPAIARRKLRAEMRQRTEQNHGTSNQESGANGAPSAAHGTDRAQQADSGEAAGS